MPDIMPPHFQFNEMPSSRAQESGTNPSHTLMYRALGVQDDYKVHAYALSLTPYSVLRPTGVLYRDNVKMTPDGWANYIIEVSYSRLNKSNTPVGTFSFSFDTTGATIKIKCAKSHIASYPDDGEWHDGAINVREGRDVEGADIIYPALKMTYTFKHPLGIVDEEFARKIARATGKTNSDEWRGYQPGELLFAGATGSDGTDTEAEVSYQMIASENATGITIGGITAIAKRGHDYAWIEFDDDVHEGEAVQRPKRVHIEAVYDEMNFLSTFGWN